MQELFDTAASNAEKRKEQLLKQLQEAAKLAQDAEEVAQAAEERAAEEEEEERPPKGTWTWLTLTKKRR